MVFFGNAESLNSTNQLIVPVTTERKAYGTVQRKQRLGGSLNYYDRDAA